MVFRMRQHKRYGNKNLETHPCKYLAREEKTSSRVIVTRWTILTVEKSLFCGHLLQFFLTGKVGKEPQEKRSWFLSPLNFYREIASLNLLIFKLFIDVDVDSEETSSAPPTIIVSQISTEEHFEGIYSNYFSHLSEIGREFRMWGVKCLPRINFKCFLDIQTYEVYILSFILDTRGDIREKFCLWSLTPWIRCHFWKA